MIPLLNPHSGGKGISMIEFASFGFFGTHSACSLQPFFLLKGNLFPWRQIVSLCQGCQAVKPMARMRKLDRDGRAVRL